MMLFDQDVFFNIPPIPGHATAPIDHILGRNRRARHPSPGGLMIPVGVRPRFHTLHIMEPGPHHPPGLGIPPRVLDVVSPPEGLLAISPLGLQDRFGFDPMLASRVVLPRWEVTVFEDQHEIPAISA